MENKIITDLDKDWDIKYHPDIKGVQIIDGKNGLISQMKSDSLYKCVKRMIEDENLQNHVCENLKKESPGTEEEIFKIYKINDACCFIGRYINYKCCLHRKSFCSTGYTSDEEFNGSRTSYNNSSFSSCTAYGSKSSIKLLE